MALSCQCTACTVPSGVSFGRELWEMSGKMAARTLPLKLIQVVCDHFTVVNRTIHLFLF